MKNLFSLLLLMFCLYFSLTGIDLYKPFEQSMHTVWTIKQGLPSDSINDILQDRKGYIWIGTFNGLVRFDGINFLTFSRYDKRGFESNSVTTLFEAKDGSLWIGTNGDGIARYFNNIFTMHKGVNLIDRVINSISGDNSGNIWVGTGTGLIRYNLDKKFDEPFNGLYNNISIEMVYHDLKDQTWISTSEGGVSIFAGDKKKIISGLEILKKYVILSVFEDNYKNIWIGTRNNGLYVLKDDKLSNFNKTNQFGAKTITAISEGEQNCIWISTDSGLYRYHKNSVYRFSEDNGLSNNQVSKILEDKEGNVWIATSRGGINKLSDSKFITITAKQGLVHDKVNSVFQETGNIFWIGTDGGLSILKDGVFLDLPITKMLEGVRIRHINKDSGGRIWISTYSDSGIITYKDEKIKKYSVKDGLSGNRCRVSIEDSSNNIWIGTSTGLNIIKNDKKIITYTKNEGLADNYILSIFEDSRKNIWITTNGGGISVFKEGKFKIFKVRDGLASNIVFRTFEDSEKNLWFSTSKGLSRYDHTKFFSYTELHGIPEKAIFQVIEDGRGRFWMIAETGIFTVLKNKLNNIAGGGSDFIKVTLYNDLDGLLDSPTPVSWATITEDGKSWFPTLKGISIIDTLNIPINEKPPPLLIESIRIDNKNYSPGEIHALSPNYRRITFIYTALSYVIPHKVQYKYKLEGFDQNWSELTTKREVSYTTLPPGNYTFRIKAVNNDGIWNTGDVKVPFEQKPFFYQTLWFFLLTIFFFLGIIALLLGLRIRALRKRGIELEKLVAERTIELETTDKIVANINKEINFDKLLRVLLQQTMILFPQAERGVIFTYNRLNNTLEQKVSIGDDSEKISGITLAFDETFSQYLKSGKEYEDGIYVLGELTKVQHPNELLNIDMPESVIVMTIMSGDTLEGFFILGNMSKPDAFNRSDAKKMMRIKEHAISAVIKARTHQKLEEAAIKDPLTSLNNRRKMIEVLENELIRFERTRVSFCIVMCDIDYFKNFNDSHGHDCGDFVLVEVSRLIRSTIRKQDYVGRWGGEEFLLVYPETKIDGGKIVSEKVRKAIQDKVFDFNGNKLKITMTFGVSEFKNEKSIDSGIKDADDALYKGKQSGRNCVIAQNWDSKL